ncbi:MAG: hypothetical protein Q8K29_10620 [Polaromonas sp.]|nr:hypothetical protein [Polaromonas sp.]
MAIQISHNPLVYWVCGKYFVFSYRYKYFHETRQPSAAIDPLARPTQGRIRYLHYSVRIEKLDVDWVRFFIRWHGMKHPRDMRPGA